MVPPQRWFARVLFPFLSVLVCSSLCEAAEAPASAEAIVGEAVVRVGLPLVCVVVGVWAHIRISREVSVRVELPADLKAMLKGLTHEVAEASESFDRHIKKEQAREGHEQQRQKKAQAAASAALDGTPGTPEGVVRKVAADVWDSQPEPIQRQWAAWGWLRIPEGTAGAA